MEDCVLFGSVDEMAVHGKQHNKILVCYSGAVYDLTKFAPSHPGGELMVSCFQGKCIDDVLFNKYTHMHKPGIVDTLDKYIYGYIDPQSHSKTPNEQKLSSCSVTA